MFDTTGSYNLSWEELIELGDVVEVTGHFNRRFNWNDVVSSDLVESTYPITSKEEAIRALKVCSAHTCVGILDEECGSVWEILLSDVN